MSGGVVAAVVLVLAYVYSAPAVEVIAAGRGSVVSHLSTTGLVDAKMSEVGPPTPGRVEKIYCDEGDRVQKGQALARVVPSPSALPLGSISSAGAVAGGGSSTVGAQVVQAPFDGVVARKYAEEGDTTGLGQPLFSIADIRRTWVTALVDDTDLDKLRIGQRVRVSLPAYLSHVYDGTIVSIGATAEPRTPALPEARVVRAKVSLDRSSAELKPGIEVNVEGDVVLRDDCLVVPADGIVEEGTRRFVWRLNGGRVERREVKTGATNYVLTEILSGLAEGNRIVLTQKEKLGDGRRIRAREVSWSIYR